MIELDNDIVRKRLLRQKEEKKGELKDIEWLLAIIGEDCIEISDPLEVARALRRLHIIG